MAFETLLCEVEGGLARVTLSRPEVMNGMTNRMVREAIAASEDTAEAFRAFSLHNAVLPVGNQFIEVVSPVQEGTAAGRQLQRLGGDGG